MTRIAGWRAFAMSLLLIPSASDAAVRACGDIIAMAGEDRASEAAAKQKAVAGWTASAAKLGPAFVLWRNAAERSLSCMKLASGIWRCQAYGRPCGVSQVPGGLPPNTKIPQAPPAAKAKALPI